MEIQIWEPNSDKVINTRRHSMPYKKIVDEECHNIISKMNTTKHSTLNTVFGKFNKKITALNNTFDKRHGKINKRY